MIANNPGRLVESNMVINPSPPCAIHGTKIDFMDRSDQWMVNWYRTAGKWIREGKQAVKMTRLSVIAYNLGNLMAEIGAAEQNRQLVADQLAATVG
jgi:hypothetical protein